MPPIPPLFTIPIAATKGSVTVTEPLPLVYLITFTSGADNRLIPDFISAVTLALDILDLKFPHGVVVTTSGIQKFYSNGLDPETAFNTPGFLENVLFPFWKRLLTYPMPTVAWINGHGFAGALMTAMMHDYRVMNPERGMVCLNELELGIPLKPAMSAIFRDKISDRRVYRDMVLEAKRYKGGEALQAGIVDGTGGFEEVKKLIETRKLVGKAKTGVLPGLREEMYRETLKSLSTSEKETDEEWEGRYREHQERMEKAGKKVDEFVGQDKHLKGKL